MGTSDWRNISDDIDFIRKIKPKKILDIGCGYGRWGILCREFLDIWEGNLQKENWKIKIDGIEAFAANIEDYHRYFYNNIYNMDARDYINNNNVQYDLVIFGDVLEHFDKSDGITLLNKCMKFAKYVLINIPLGDNWEQEALYDNPYEVHKSEWEESDFQRYSIVRKKFFADYLGRKFGIFVLTTQGFRDDLLLYTHKIEEEIAERKNYLKNDYLYIEYLQELKNLYPKSEDIESDELLLTSSNISIGITERKNIESLGNEVWLYYIGTDVVETLDLKKMKKSADWLIREAEESPTNECLIASCVGSKIEFKVQGDVLTMKCLSHPWSGILEIKKDEKIIYEKDLYNNTNEIILLSVNLKDVYK